jgi:hypothetical protein
LEKTLGMGPRVYPRAEMMREEETCSGYDKLRILVYTHMDSQIRHQIDCGIAHDPGTGERWPFLSYFASAWLLVISGMRVILKDMTISQKRHELTEERVVQGDSINALHGRIF